MNICKIYKLIGSEKISTITAYNDQYETSLTVRRKDGTGYLVEKAIVSAIDDLVESQSIDIKLALVLYSDYAHLLQGKSLTFPNSSLITPFTCSDRSQELLLNLSIGERASNDAILFFSESSEPNLADQLFTSQKKFSFEDRTLGMKQLFEKIVERDAKEEEDFQKALSLSIQSAPKLIEVVQHLNIEKTNAHFLEAGVTKSTEKTPLQTYSCFSKYSPEFQVINSHKIDDFTCEFKNDGDDILFSIFTNEEDKDTLRISADTKKDLLGCHHLVDLGKILRNIKHGENSAAMIEQYVASKENACSSI